MNEKELYDFIKYFTFRFFGQEFTDYKMFNYCYQDWKQEQWRASHSDLWPEQPKPKKQAEEPS